MRKLFLHLSLACITFFLGLVLTQLVEFAYSPQSEPQSCGAPVREVVIQLRNLEETSASGQLREIYREYGWAKTRHDRAFFERVESENYVLFLRDRTMTREENISWMETWPSGIFYNYEIETMRIIGDAGVVTGRMEARYPTGSIAVQAFIDVWAKNGDRWEILSTTSVE
jgi:hypothetical protein